MFVTGKIFRVLSIGLAKIAVSVFPNALESSVGKFCLLIVSCTRAASGTKNIICLKFYTSVYIFNKCFNIDLHGTNSAGIVSSFTVSNGPVM